MNTICEKSVTSDTAVGDDVDSRSVSTLDINDCTSSIDVSLNVKHDVNKTDEKNLPHTVPTDTGGWVTSADDDAGYAGDADDAGGWGAYANTAIAAASVLLAVVIVAVVVAVAAARGPLCTSSPDRKTLGLCNSSDHT